MNRSYQQRYDRKMMNQSKTNSSNSVLSSCSILNPNSLTEIEQFQPNTRHYPNNFSDVSNSTNIIYPEDDSTPDSKRSNTSNNDKYQRLLHTMQSSAYEPEIDVPPRPRDTKHILQPHPHPIPTNNNSSYSCIGDSHQHQHTSQSSGVSKSVDRYDRGQVSSSLEGMGMGMGRPTSELSRSQTLKPKPPWTGNSNSNSNSSGQNGASQSGLKKQTHNKQRPAHGRSTSTSTSASNSKSHSNNGSGSGYSNLVLSARTVDDHEWRRLTKPGHILAPSQSSGQGNRGRSMSPTKGISHTNNGNGSSNKPKSTATSQDQRSRSQPAGSNGLGSSSKGKKVGSNPRTITLNSCVQKHAANNAALDTHGKLHLASCYMSVLDPVPVQLARRVKVLYLSNNSLRSLQGIQQFTRLTSISVANNHIRYVHDLMGLASLPHLEKLGLEGNTVTLMPYYRELVLGLCLRPSSGQLSTYNGLLQIDGQKVTPEEQANVRVRFRQVSRIDRG